MGRLKKEINSAIADRTRQARVGHQLRVFTSHLTCSGAATSREVVWLTPLSHVCANRACGAPAGRAHAPILCTVCHACCCARDEPLARTRRQEEVVPGSGPEVGVRAEALSP